MTEFVEALHQVCAVTHPYAALRDLAPGFVGVLSRGDRSELRAVQRALARMEPDAELEPHLDAWLELVAAAQQRARHAEQQAAMQRLLRQEVGKSILPQMAAGWTSQAALVDASDRNKSQVSRFLSRLRGQGLLEERAHPSDARSREVRLSPAGRHALKKKGPTGEQLLQLASVLVDRVLADAGRYLQEGRGHQLSKREVAKLTPLVKPLWELRTLTDRLEGYLDSLKRTQPADREWRLRKSRILKRAQRRLPTLLQQTAPAVSRAGQRKQASPA